MTKAEAILNVDAITYIQGAKKSLFGTARGFTLGPISFSMANGETIAIIGNNGSGKTLLAKALAGAVPFDAGSITLNQLDVNAKSAAVIESDKSTSGKGQPQLQTRTKTQDIRLILQHNADAINPSLSIGNILTQTLHLNTKLNDAEKREKIEDTLVKVGLLREHYYYYRHMLSDGQQQRIGLARALILDPKIIVADEPFAALDPSVRSQTINLILQLQKELGLGFVFISHNIGIVRHISDRVLVLDKGKIVEQGPTTEVFSNPQHAVTQKLIQAHFTMVEKHFAQL